MGELLIGCGNSRLKRVSLDQRNTFSGELVTLDIDPHTDPDVLHNLNDLPYPFDDGMFSEIHAYEVLEHLGSQGDYIAFFDLFAELWRISEPDGLLCVTVPAWNSVWAFGDPGHRRVINEGSLVFLSQKQYESQVGVTPMTDYRDLYHADWDILYSNTEEHTFTFVLRAVK